MKRILMLATLSFVFLLSGCIGESYDFTPPSVSLEQKELEEANINWDSDKEYTKETEDILSLAKEQKPLYFSSGEQVTILFDSQDFAIEELSAQVWQNDNKTELQVNDQDFSLPKEKGEYVVVVDLISDSGTAQYVGNIVINE
ncbi:hypothetical protein [Halobacillus campisalis]|uniref:Intracellular proteinase inhibitor BsuPI domain-containing protein n=1 Tax=Halobacillus campisalis TaxID=435909 RepID=A0ABW2K5L7_9BACI|nr:hypothetical protein [Halobacillus campisalis]